MGIANTGHMRVRKQEVEGDGQEGQVSHEGEILAVHDDVVHSVGEGEPVQGLAHTVQVGVSDAHGQVVVVQTLRRKDKRVQAHITNVVVFLMTGMNLSRTSVALDYQGDFFILSTGRGQV